MTQQIQLMKAVAALSLREARNTDAPNSKVPAPFYSEPLPRQGQSFRKLSSGHVLQLPLEDVC